MGTSILKSIKKKLGPTVCDNYFDEDIVSYINTCLQRLCGIGVGTRGFYVNDTKETWEDFEPNFNKLRSMDTYTYLRCRLFFDPPQNSNITATIEKQIDEIVWTLEVDSRRIHDDEEENDNADDQGS